MEKIKSKEQQMIDVFEKYINGNKNEIFDYCLEDYMRIALDYISSLEQENQELKKQLNEKIISEMKLKDKLEEQRKEYQETYKDVREEIKEYKRKLENCYCNRTDCSSRIKNSKKYDSLVQKVEKQQKEFIEWLEKIINNLDNDINKINGLSENSKREKERVTIKYNILIQIMKKFKEIVGG